MTFKNVHECKDHNALLPLVNDLLIQTVDDLRHRLERYYLFCLFPQSKAGEDWPELTICLERIAEEIDDLTGWEIKSSHTSIDFSFYKPETRETFDLVVKGKKAIPFYFNIDDDVPFFYSQEMNSISETVCKNNTSKFSWRTMG